MHKQYEILNAVVRYGQENGMTHKSWIVLIVLLGMLDTRRGNHVTIAVSRLHKKVGVGRISVQEGIKGLKELNIISYAKSNSCKIDLDVDNIMELCRKKEVEDV